MAMRILAYSFAMALLMGASAPTTQPGTRLATTRVSGNENPKRALTVYAVAMSTGDARMVRDCYQADTPEEKAVVEAYGHLATAVAGLRKAAIDQYGPDGFDNIGFAKMFADQIKALEATRIVIEGDLALAFVNADQKPDLYLVKSPSGWKISAHSFSNPVRQAARLEAQSAAYNELASEITAKKYRLSLDARAAGAEKVREAMLAVDQRLKAATQPTGQQSQ